MRRKSFKYDVVVCGGGLAGYCAAIASARSGAKTCLIHDRPVFGGNSSSEIRVAPQGAATHHGYGRETGIISELLVEDRARNHERYIENGGMNSVWDMVLYDLAVTTANLTFHLNTSLFDVVLDDGTSGLSINETHAEPHVELGFALRPACNTSRKIREIHCRVANAELELQIEGKIFIDCTGDGVLAHLAGCEWRMGTESQSELGEYHAAPSASTDTMGSSIHFKTKLCPDPVSFTPPSWAVRYDDASFFYKQGRIPWDARGGFWWIEIGVPWHTIHDAEDIRHELTRHALGVWDWIKNRDPKLKEQAANYSLDWIGQVPGKRESRRIMGNLLMTENDVGRVFDDEVAYGGWFIDLHTPGGLLAEHSEKRSAGDMDYAAKSYTAPYGIPLRALVSKDIDNLMMAGRNVSVTKATLGTVRVMCTTALMGQGVGTAAAMALEHTATLAEMSTVHASALRQRLLRDNCFLVSTRNEDPKDLARLATATASSEAVIHGVGPESTTELGGLGAWYARDAADMFVPPPKEPLTARRGQWIPIARPEITSLSVCLSNDSDEVQTVQVELHSVDGIWDYRVEPGKPLAVGTLRIPPGRLQWIEWPVHLEHLPKDRYVRLDLLANPQVDWHSSPAIIPGCLSAFALNSEKMRRYNVGHTLCFRVQPAQPAYQPANALSGVTRPHAWTNLWRSNPSEPFDQWIELSWPEAQKISTVELTFPGHLIRQFAAYPPQYRDPQCARDYSIQFWSDEEWIPSLKVEGNYQPHRKHTLPAPIESSRIRVVVHATNGDPSAGVYGIRCYA